MSLKSAFSSKVYHKRKELKLTQAQVAEALSISVRWYQHIEKGAFLPGSTVMLRLMVLLDLNPQDFCEEVGLRDIPVSAR